MKNTSTKQRPGRRSSWTRIALPAEQQMRRQLQSRHWLRLHAWLTGLFTLAVMAALSAILLHVGMHSMALRYGLVLAAGYGVYLLLVRLWAEAMLRRSWDGPADLPIEVPWPGGATPGEASAELSGQGGSFAGGGASGGWDSGGEALGSVAENLAEGAGGVDLSAGLDAADAEGVVLLPVLLVFGLLLLALTGAGSLLWLMFGSELFLAVAVEVAFALLMARTLYVVEREGWLLVALRLTWKPVLGALLVTVALGWAGDFFFPQADSLAQVVAALRGR
ncbi:MAG: hypothetical protein RR720_06940 [Comamonas sp.]|uniref:hypothetical protein n=1 Tax=Comamonas sp. TaxID=34028 RepID=UPI002FCB61E8